MTPTDLKYYHENSCPGSLFFSKGAMRMFGDTMKNYGVRSNGDYWELWRKKTVKSGLNDSVFFSKDSYKIVRFA